MKKKVLYVLSVLVPMFVFSCAKESSLPELETPSERKTMIDPWTAIDQSPYTAEPVIGPEISVNAGFEDTKASLSVGSSYADVVWSAGDEFTMFAWNGSSFSLAEYSTVESGAKVAFTTMYTVGGNTPQHSIYGVKLADLQLGYSPEDGTFFGLNIPRDQLPQANSVKDEYLYSYARTVNQTDDFHFKNILSLVRFKMTGAAVSTVRSITLQGASPLAGDCVLIPAADGTPQITFSRKFYGDVSSTTVKLNGLFEADTWYYMAVAPGTQASLSLSFSDGERVTTKISTRAATFSSGTISSLGTINLGDELDIDPNKTIKYKSSSKPKPVTFAVIPEGFTQGEMGTYEMLAKLAINTIFSVEPFKSYEEYFNAYILKVPSNESGARITDGTVAEQNRDCYFESTWGKNSYQGANAMRANADKIFLFVADKCPDIIDGSRTIDEVPVLMIINDARYGGINITYSTGRAYCMAPYTYSGAPLTWGYPGVEAASDSDPSSATITTPDSRYTEDLGISVGGISNEGNWLNTMIHEFAGHCFSRLKDEYWYNNTEKDPETYIDSYRWPVPFGQNISATYANPGYDADSGAEGWQHLLDQRETLIASDPRYGRIGVFQGGDVSIHNRWRSERVSCMIDNRLYFSAFQRELIVRRILGLAGETFNFSDFLAKDKTIDPNRDIAVSPVMGPRDPVTPRPMPPLPPPVLVESF